MQQKITGMGDPNNVANIGGAAGVNGLGAQISYVTFGTDKRYDVSFGGEAKETAVKNAKGSVYVGTGNSTTAYGHTGGVAGFNSGSISDICHEGSDRAYGEAPVDEMRVIVENYRGACRRHRRIQPEDGKCAESGDRKRVGSLCTSERSGQRVRRYRRIQRLQGGHAGVHQPCDGGEIPPQNQMRSAEWLAVWSVRTARHGESKTVSITVKSVH